MLHTKVLGKISFWILNSMGAEQQGEMSNKLWRTQSLCQEFPKTILQTWWFARRTQRMQHIFVPWLWFIMGKRQIKMREGKGTGGEVLSKSSSNLQVFPPSRITDGMLHSSARNLDVRVRCYLWEPLNKDVLPKCFVFKLGTLSIVCIKIPDPQKEKQVFCINCIVCTNMLSIVKYPYHSRNIYVSRGELFTIQVLRQQPRDNLASGPW